MKSSYRIFSGLMAWVAVLAWMGMAGGLGACGGDDVSLTISPAGPVVVEKGSTQQFTANLAGVTWSVEGGAANGSIDADGLYTPPATLPIDPQVTVVASLPDQEDSALVNLRTADTVAFPPANEATIINDTPVDPSLLFVTIVIGGMGDHLAVSSGSIHVNATWFNGSGEDGDAFFAQALDFGPFSDERNLTASLTDIAIPAHIDNDADLNPQILLVTIPPESTPTPDPISQVSLLTSGDQGVNFGSPIPVAPSSLSQSNPAMRRDANGDLHVVYSQGAEISESVLGTIFYVRSNDNGLTWSTPVPVAPPPTSPLAYAFPYLAVDETGEVVHVCFSQFPDENDVDIGFISVAKSEDGGASFQPALDFPSAPDSSDLLCRNELGANGEVYVVFSRDSDPLTKVLFASSTDGGDSYSEPQELGDNAAASRAFAMMAVDSLGRIDLVWAEDPAGDNDFSEVHYTRSADGGANFLPDVVLAAGADVGFPFGLRHDSSGRVHVQYASDINDPATSLDVFYLVGQ